MKKRKSPSPSKRASQPLTLLGQSRGTTYPDSPERAILEAFPNRYPRRDYWITFDCPEFTALCPITGQPDFGHLVIRYIPNQWCVESKALKLYLFAYRNHGTFHEEVVNRVLDDLVRAVRPRRAIVRGDFNRRGGIAISVEACHPAPPETGQTRNPSSRRVKRKRPA